MQVLSVIKLDLITLLALIIQLESIIILLSVILVEFKITLELEQKAEVLTLDESSILFDE